MRTENWGIVTLAPDVKFMAKTEGQSGNVVQRTLEIKALAKFLGQDMEQDKKLCPVRAIRIYTERTDELRGERERLILSFKEGMKKDISKNTVSSYLKRTIQMTYELAGKSEELQRLHKVKAHEVRAMAASWAFFNNVSAEDIMAACSWKSHNTFTSYLL